MLDVLQEKQPVRNMRGASAQSTQLSLAPFGPQALFLIESAQCKARFPSLQRLPFLSYPNTASAVTL